MQLGSVFRCVPVLLVILLFPSRVAAQHPSFIEPYEVLYGKPQPLARALTKDKLQPTDATLLLVQARTDAILGRLKSMTLRLDASASDSSRRWATSVKKHRASAVRLRDRGRFHAALHRASKAFLDYEFLIGTLASETVVDGSTQRLQEARAKLELFHSRLALLRHPSAVFAWCVAGDD